MGNKARALAAVGALAILGGSFGPFNVWSGFKRPTADDYARAATAAPCPAVGVQNLTADRRAILLAALADVCDILADPEFARRIEREPEWFADCLGNGMPGARVAVADVLAALVPPRHAFSVVARKPWWAEAVTNLSYQAIAIRKQRFDAWASGVPAQQAEMIETLTHEMTHLVPERAGSTASLFKDENHEDSQAESDRDRCLDSKLVSYDSGAIVAQLWLERHAAAAGTAP